jgi:hypothetical protein
MTPRYEQLELALKSEEEIRAQQSARIVIERELERLLKDLMENPKK